MMKIILDIVVFLSVAVFGSVRTSETSLVDASQPGSPVVLSGAVTAHDEIATEWIRFSFRTSISATNVSQKSILLILLKIDMTSANGLGIHHSRSNDYFFTTDVFSPDSSQTIEETIGPVGELQGKTEAQPPGPTAIAEVVFVQFADGSTWGNSSEGKDILQERRATWDRLRFLMRVHQSKSQKDFIDDLMQTSRLPGIGHLQWLYKNNNSDPAIVFKNLADMLHNAELHQSAMTR
jgi:hypothetical protein